MSTGVAVAPEVAAALARGGAVVALESTIISHGMPYPKNLQTAMEVEAIVRENGAVPATIAILDGVPHVGLSSEQLRRLAISGRQFQKTARRDIAHVVASGGNGATTVSATMFFAHKVGIPIFVTGGIGGVHRQGEQSVHYYAAMDISSDLTELGNTPVAVISAGVKSILDIPRTLEYLETQGVTVAAYKTNEFPAFFTENSGSQVPCRVDSPEECAKIIHANKNLHLGSGILIAVPIPKQHAASGNVIESAIQKALKEADDKRIIGNAITPFMLERVKELTGGSSLEANIALVKNNAVLGAKIAVALSNLEQRKTNRLGRSAL
ncbi:pseudouridine-5'-phosphate glycosidase-like isoform X1 [Phragmites australis]|uniref:pseudouridine-5'-phosphate glycosidase-like isoform X1 n=1 Tax=Phragmites australis TaxID=29695 RepID=UPI002D76C4EF|nr:pseudouridine-5'-phosphate glycosidase-like isoform X1 [Phragmites australis]